MDLQTKKYSLPAKEKGIIKEKISACLLTIQEILFAYVHGSFIADGFRDIDLAVYLRNNIQEPTLYEIDLEMKLEKLINHPIDVRVLNSAPLSFQSSVIKTGTLLFSKDEDLRIDFQVLTLKMYFDFEPFRRRYMKEVFSIEI
ncbi:MAG: hypothetical protein VR69_02960 [Peptococcaceae bacterium BRH_c4b]|nr:MAG: hypothetical protein VR69_02960 [Peptococcaceae bacterium BRH_c4b]